MINKLTEKSTTFTPLGITYSRVYPQSTDTVIADAPDYVLSLV
jgi:hypothetical protein